MPKRRRKKSKPKSNLLEFELPWQETWVAVEYHRRRKRDASYSFRQFIAEQGLPLTDVCANLEGKLLLWHGTTVERARSILQKGFCRPKGIWMTEDAQQAHSIAHFQAKRWRSLPAILISVVDFRGLKEGTDFEVESPGVYVFRFRVPPEVVQYMLTPDGLQMVGRAIGMKKGKGRITQRFRNSPQRAFVVYGFK